MKLLINLLISACFIFPAYPQDVDANFVLYAPGLSDTSTVYITGSVQQLGNWHPARVKMDPAGSHTWRKQIRTNAGSTVEYKYTLGSWDREAVSSDGMPLRNFSVRILQANDFYDTVYHWKRNAVTKKHGQVTGTVKYHRAMKIQGLPERDIVVWLPPGYEQRSSRRYPVIYMQDGQNVFDPATSAFGYDWEIDEAADSMIRKGSVGPVIIVGIYNTAERNKEYIPSEKSKKYMQFIAEELKPFIDSAYKTKPGRRHNFIGGSSSGGILAFMMVWEYPGMFSRAICMSPAFRLPGNSPGSWNFVKVVSAGSKRRDVFFYIDNGGIGLEKQLQPGIDEMLNALKQKGYKEGKDLIYVSDPAAAHNEQAWAERFPNALKIIMSRR